MSIITRENLRFFPNSEARKGCCFYCGAPLEPPAVQWMGTAIDGEHTSHLLLHPHCAVELFIRLTRDVHEIECRTGEYVTGKPGMVAYRERLLREEGL